MVEKEALEHSLKKGDTDQLARGNEIGIYESTIESLEHELKTKRLLVNQLEGRLGEMEGSSEYQSRAEEAENTIMVQEQKLLENDEIMS